MDTGVIIALISAGVAIGGALLNFRTSARASKVEHRKVDQVAFDQAINFYEKQLERVTAQADRLTAQLDRVAAQLASEQEVSNTLRTQVRILQSQVEALNNTIADLRTRVANGHSHPS